MALVALLTPALGSAQSEGVTPADSTPPRGAAASDRVTSDTVRTDSVASGSTASGDAASRGAASGEVVSDSVASDSVAGDSARKTAPAVRSPAPTDSLLGAACGETGGAPPDLIVVKFRPSATADERAAVAGEVGGTVQGPSELAPGSWYLRVPGGAGDRSVADRLIQMSPVLEVGVTRCSP